MKPMRCILLLLLLLLFAACIAQGTLVERQSGIPTPAPISEPNSQQATAAMTPTDESKQEGSSSPPKHTAKAEATVTKESFTPDATLVPTLSATQLPENDIVVEGTQPCQRPPDDLSRVDFKDIVLNTRTLWMLHLANNIYAGRGDPLRVTQGSYTEGEDLSFGTHGGGGAVDISIRVKSDPSQVLSIDEAGELVRALRLAGFAAWLRLPEDLTPSVPLHIHAIAVGDPTLSPAALQQLVGPEGYFRGLDGVPSEFGGPRQDRYGGPVLCDWMIEMGFTNLR